MKILIADDEMISRANIRRMIRSYCPWAGPVAEAADGRQAVEAARERDADVVLMDIEMPEMDGMEAARMIRQWKEGCVIIFLTAFATFQYARQAISVGASEFLVKPVDPEELRQVLERVRGKLRGKAETDCGEAETDCGEAEANCGEAEADCGEVQLGADAGQAGTKAVRSGFGAAQASANAAQAPANAIQASAKSASAAQAAADVSDSSFLGGRAGKIGLEGKRYMDLHYMDDIGVDTMARMYQVSSNYFNKVFKQVHHISCKEYLINIRVEHAMDYLRNPAMTIREAGIMVGYEDANYFARIFKKKTGMTPIEYRNKCFLQPDE